MKICQESIKRSRTHLIKVNTAPISFLFQGEECLCYYLYTRRWPTLFILLLNLIESERERKKENFKGLTVEQQRKHGLASTGPGLKLNFIRLLLA